MVRLNILSWNVQGINDVKKRRGCLDILREKAVDIALLQETHLICQDVCKLNCTDFKTVAFSAAKNRTKGVIILFRSNLKISIIKKGSDQLGRIAYVKTILNGERIAFISAYAPNTYDNLFFASLSSIINEMNEYKIILGSDLNTAIEPIDRTSSTNANSPSTRAVKDLMHHYALVDIWRKYNPHKKDYTHYSGRHQSFSRIDYVLVSSQMTHMTTKAEIVYMSLSDHHANLCTIILDQNSKRATRWRFNTTLLLNPSFCDQFRNSLKEFIRINKDSVSDVRILWDATKGFIRNNSISFASAQNRARLRELTNLEQTYSSLIHQQHVSFSADRDREISIVKVQLNGLIAKRSEFLIHRSRQSHYLDGSKPSFLLASKLRNNDRLAEITSIQAEDGSLLSDPTLINKQFEKYYKELYQSEINDSSEAMNSFFRDLELPSLSAEEKNNLDTPITLDEIFLSLKQMKKGKSPGLDGIPPELYLTFWEDLGPLILNMFQKALQEGSFNRDVKTAIISLLCKSGKDPTLCASYRPISLLNSDKKLFAKTLALRLDAVIPKLVHPDQSGFVKNRLATDNVRRLLHIISSTSLTSTILPPAVVSIDGDKAFDRLEWSFLWFTLKRMGFGKQFLSMLNTLYNNPFAQVLTGTHFSSLFPVSRGSPQGCPVSSLLFAVSLEPLAQKIRQLQTTTPIMVGNISNHISMYADDILLYLGNTPSDLPKIMDTFSSYSTFSGYKINLRKCALLPLGKAAAYVGLQTEIPQVTTFKYLGINIFSSIDRIAANNYKTLRNSICNDLDRWFNQKLSLSSRISIINMNILPRVNFVSSMLPLPTPPRYWTQIQGLATKFIWKGERPRIKNSILHQSKQQGGFELPNFELYHISFAVRSLEKWFSPEENNSWLKMEQNLVSPYKLNEVLFCGLSTKHAQLKFGPVISHLIYIWQQAEKIGKWNVKWHTHTPIFKNLSLCIERKPLVFPAWSSCGIHTFSDIFNSEGLRSFEDLKNTYGIPTTYFFFYLQLRAVIQAHGVPWRNALPAHPLFKCITNIPKCEGFVSHVYKKLRESTCPPMGVPTVWNVDLKNWQQPVNWKRVWESVSLSSRNYNYQMLNFKFIHRFYLTPRKRFQLQLCTTPICTLCNTNKLGTYMHMMWECPDVNAFWARVSQVLSEVMGTHVPLLPNVLMLNDDSAIGFTIPKRRLFLLGLTAAKKLLVQRWKPPHKLEPRQWILTLMDIITLELSIARSNGAKENILDTLSTALEKLKTCY